MDLTTTVVAAVRLDVPEKTVRNWCASGHLPARQVGGVWLIDPAALAGLARPARGRPKSQDSAAPVRRASEKPRGKRGKKNTCKSGR